jgi:hypothetical protein
MSNVPPPWPPGGPAPLPGDQGDDQKIFDAPTQKVFDTLTGPNLRLRDNLIQLAAIVVGTGIGAGAGAIIAKTSGNELPVGLILGGFAGLLLSLFLSGFVIGLVRAVLAMKR